MLEPDRFFFVRPQRTASTTLIRRMTHYFGEAAIYPAPSDRRSGDPPGEAATSADRLVEQLTARSDEVRVVAGHFPLSVASLLECELRTFIVLRDPVERTLSWLRQRSRKAAKDLGMSLEDIYNRRGIFRGLWGQNHFTKMLSVTTDELVGGIAGGLRRVHMTPDRLDRAKANLVSLNLVGIQERFEEFCDDLNEHFGWSLGREPRRENTSEPMAVSDAFRERIAVDNAADVEVYQLARRLVDERHPAAPSNRDRPGVR